MLDLELGDSIPPNTSHAVSVSLPTWQSNVGYEEGQEWVVERMKTGYPRFFIHASITLFAQDVVAKHGRPGQVAMLFSSPKAAARCVDFVKRRSPSPTPQVEQLDLCVDGDMSPTAPAGALPPRMSAVICTEDAFTTAKEYWQHTGDGCSSRMAEFCHNLFRLGVLSPPKTATAPCPSAAPTPNKTHRGPKRYSRRSPPGENGDASTPGVVLNSPPQSSESLDSDEANDCRQFVEERFGRNLDLSLARRATSAIKSRIVEAVNGLDQRMPASRAPLATPLTESQVYLFPCGMNAIYNAHRSLLEARGSLRSINYGFPYVDTLKILQKFGPGCEFFATASEGEIDRLEERLIAGERFLALFCEFPGNPLLTAPNLARLRRLADAFDFAIVVDETIGTFANVNVLPLADIVVSSLTKVFSGDCNVMGGSLILNPNGTYFGALKRAMGAIYEDNYWPEDVIFMERNSRDYLSRVERINANSEAICQVLRADPGVKAVYYPKYNDSRCYYDACRLPSGGYGGLLSVTFLDWHQSMLFYDALDTAKGPSLGTNFTLTCPYVLLAHYKELEWAAGLGVDPYLIRVSVGLENTQRLVEVFQYALVASKTEKVSGA